MEVITFLKSLENKRWVFLSLIFGILFTIPILILLIKFFQTSGNAFNYIWDNLLYEYSFNTFYLIFITSTLALLLGVIPAWFISKYQFKGKNFFDIALYLPLAIPSYIMAFTYIDILSFTGPIQSFVRHYLSFFSTILNRDYMQIEVLGILLSLALYPYVYTASRIAFSLIGSNYIDLSKNLGLSSFRFFYKVVLPLSRPAILSGLFLVVMEVLNEYGAVIYFGINTYTSGIFKAWFSFGDVDTAIHLAALLIIVVFSLFSLERFTRRKTKFYYKANTNTLSLTKPKRLKYLQIYLVCSIPFLFGFVIPFLFITHNMILSFEILKFWSIVSLTLNTVFVSSLSSFLIILIALLVLFTEKISKNPINTFLNQVISLGYAVPGAVIALGVILLITFLDTTNYISFPLIGTFFVLIYAYVIRFLAVGKSPIETSLTKQPDSYDDTGKNLGLGLFRLLQKIHLPINKYALISAFIVAFIDIMKELPITLILRPFNFDTLATQTYEYAIEEMLPLSSIYSFIIIVIGSVLLILLKQFINKQLDVS